MNALTHQAVNKVQLITKGLSEQGYSEAEVMALVSESLEEQGKHNVKAAPYSVYEAMSAGNIRPLVDYLGPWPVDAAKFQKGNMEAGSLTLLEAAVANIDKEPHIPQFLLQMGANCDHRNSFGSTPFELTSKYYGVQPTPHRNELLKAFLEWGGGTNEADAGEAKFVGRRCEIVNLDHRKDLVGQTCLVRKFIAKKNRFKITTEHSKETFLVGPDNLKRRDRTPDDPGYFITCGEDGKWKRHDFSSNEDCQAFVDSYRRKMGRLGNV